MQVLGFISFDFTVASVVPFRKLVVELSLIVEQIRDSFALEP